MHVDSVRELIRSHPYRPFTMRLVDGRTLSVPHPGFVAVSRRWVLFVNPETDAMSWLEPVMIVSIEFADGTGATVPKNSEGGNP